jgi:hypothetical protein
MTSRNLKSSLSISLIVLLLLSCSGGLKISSNLSKGVDLKKYKTFAWSKPENRDHESRNDDKIYSGLILQLANEELLKRGLALDTLNPDAIFIFDTRVEEGMTYSRGVPEYTGFGYNGFGYYNSYYTPGHVKQSEIETGMLYIDMLDAKTKVPIWGGWAEKKLSAKSDGEAIVRSAVKGIFSKMPLKNK